MLCRSPCMSDFVIDSIQCGPEKSVQLLFGAKWSNINQFSISLILSVGEWNQRSFRQMRPVLHSELLF